MWIEYAIRDEELDEPIFMIGIPWYSPRLADWLTAIHRG
jgi:hypothetical protein